MNSKVACNYAARGAARLFALLLCAVTTIDASAETGSRIYVTNEMSGDLSIIDGATYRVVSTVKLGKRPRGLKLAPSGKFLFVALSGSPILPPGADEASAPPADKTADGIGVVDLAKLRVMRVIKGVSDPEQLAVSTDGSRIYVASEDTGSLRVIDVNSGKLLATLPVGGEPEGVTLSPDGRFVYVTSEEDSLVSIVDITNNSVVAKLNVGKRPRFCAFSRDGTRAFVSGELDASITVIDTRTRKILQIIKLEGENVRPMGIEVSPDNKTLYVATGRGGTLLSVNAQTFRVERSVAVGPRPWNVAMSPSGNELYTANGTSNDISVVNAKTMMVTRKVAVGDRPWGVIVH